MYFRGLSGFTWVSLAPMIAAAMTTRNDRLPLYTDLAKSGAVVERNISASSCARLVSLVVDLGDISTQLRFNMDKDRRPQVTGAAQATVKLDCQLCTEPVPVLVEADIEGVLASSEEEARLWRNQDSTLNIIVVSGPELDAAELVEDELLLRLPSQVCVDLACDRRPVLSYGPADIAEPSESHRPFAGLAELAAELAAADDDKKRT
jgi:DUF177 domain-containing protein